MIEDAARTERIITKLPIGVGVFEVGDRKIIPLYFSDQFCEILAMGRDEFIASLTEDNPIGRVDIPDSKEHLEMMKQRKDGDKGEVTTEFVRNDGKTIWLRFLYTYAEDDGKQMFYCTIRDVTEEIEQNMELRWQNERFRLLAENAHIITFDYNPATDVMTYSIEAGDGKLKEIRMKDFMDYIPKSQLIHDDYKEAYKQVLTDASKHPVDLQREYVANSFGTGYQWCRAKIVSIADDSGKIYRVVGLVEDIQKEKEMEIAVLAKAARESAYRQSLTEGALVFLEFDVVTKKRIKSDTDIFPFSNVGEVTLDVGYQMILDRATHPGDADEIATMQPDKVFNMAKDLSSEERYFEFRTTSLSGKYEGYRWVSLSLTFSVDPVSGHPHVFLCIRDIDEEKQEEIDLKKIAERDPLTKLLNRDSFEKFTRAALVNAVKNDYITAFLMIDIDDFKDINDNFGHAKGDEALIYMAKKLKSTFRSDDIVARLGGDEFAVFLPNVPSIDLANKKGYELCTILNGSGQEEIGGIPMSCSVGIAMSPEHGMSFGDLYQKADLALYEAKDNGKNQCIVYDSTRMVPRVGNWANKEWILDAMSDRIYISDIETYELYYMNKPMLKRFDITRYKGKKCYELLQGRTEPCPFCTNDFLSYDEFYYWEFENPRFNIKTILQDKLINWCGRPARMEVITEVNEEGKRKV